MSLLSQFVVPSLVWENHWIDVLRPSMKSVRNYLKHKREDDATANYEYVIELLNGGDYFKKMSREHKISEVRSLGNGRYAYALYSTAQDNETDYYARLDSILTWGTSNRGYWVGRDQELGLCKLAQFEFQLDHNNKKAITDSGGRLRYYLQRTCPIDGFKLDKVILNI